MKNDGEHRVIEPGACLKAAVAFLLKAGKCFFEASAWRDTGHFHKRNKEWKERAQGICRI